MAVLTLAAIACGEGAQSQLALASPTIEFMTPAPSPATMVATSTATLSPTPVPPTPTATVAPPSPTPTVAVPTPTVAGPPTPVATVPPPPTAAVEAQSAAAIHPVGGGSGYQGQCGAYSASVAQWWPVVIRYDWDPCTALQVIQTESGGANVYNTQGSGACGVMQLLPCQYPNDGAANIAAGYAKYAAAGGWSPWMSFWE